MDPGETVSRLERAGAVAVLRLSDASALDGVVDAIGAGGVRAIEVTMTMPDALGAIAALAQRADPSLILGVGSVLDAETARRAVEAGASFVVSPIFDPRVIDAAHALGAAAMPGAFTPTEIHAATGAGADIVKVFPADVVGMAFFKGVLAPMPRLRLMPTGGVTCENAGDWIRAGAVAVGVGSALLDKRAIAARDWDALTESIRAARPLTDGGTR